jgi:hypothetical protein
VKGREMRGAEVREALKKEEGTYGKGRERNEGVGGRGGTGRERDETRRSG